MKSDFQSERGSIAILVAGLMTSLLLIGSLVLVVDGGVVYLERRELVNGAQSSALALARECAQQPTSCASSSAPGELANSSSTDGLTRVTEVCVNGRTSTGSFCQPLSNTSIDCRALASDSNFVRIRTASRSPENERSISTYFNSGNQELVACAQVRWGNAASAQVYMPFAVSICEWAKQQSLPRTLIEYDSSGGVEDCSYTFADLQGETFTSRGINGWVALDLKSQTLPTAARSNASCPNPLTDAPAYLLIGYELTQITRSQSSQNFCDNGPLDSVMTNWLGQTYYIPLVATERLAGNSTIHTVKAFAAFRLTGFAILKGNGSATTKGGTFPAGNWCPTNKSCLYGEFISTISSNSEISDIPGTPNVGLQAIELS